MIIGVWAVAVIIGVLGELNVVPDAVGVLGWYIAAGAAVATWVVPLFRGKKDVDEKD